MLDVWELYSISNHCHRCISLMQKKCFFILSDQSIWIWVLIAFIAVKITCTMVMAGVSICIYCCKDPFLAHCARP